MTNAEPEAIKDGVLPCPNGCDFNELEIGREGETLIAVMGAPYLHIRCGKCGFNDDNKVGLSTDRDGSIAHWNAAVSP